MSAENEPRIDGEEDSDPLDVKTLAIELRDEMNEAASELDKHTRNVNIARVAGGSAAVAGSVTSIIGFAVLMPFTLGLSAVAAAAVGAGIAVTGWTTAGGAILDKVFIDKFKKEDLVRKWTEFNEMLTRKLQQSNPESYQRMKEELTRKAGVAMVVAGPVSRQAVAHVATAAAAGSMVLNLVLIGISLNDIIEGSVQLHRQTGSQAGDYLRQLAQSLDEVARTGPTQEFLMSNSL